VPWFEIDGTRRQHEARAQQLTVLTLPLAALPHADTLWRQVGCCVKKKVIKNHRSG